MKLERATAEAPEALTREERRARARRMARDSRSWVRRNGRLIRLQPHDDTDLS
jgi:hypothetical protein